MRQNISVVTHPHVVAAITPNWFHYACGVVLLISAVISLFLDGSMVYIFGVKFRNKLNRMMYYIISMSLISIIMTACATPMTIISSFQKNWIFGKIGCMYYGFTVTFCGFVKIVILTLMCVDRFIYIVLNNLSTHLMAGFSITLMVISIFLSLSFAIRPLFGWNEYVYEGVGTSCSIDIDAIENNARSFVIAILIAFFAVPVCIMILSYGSVIIMVKMNLTRILPSENGENGPSLVMTKLQQEKRLIVALSWTIVFFLFCWTPYAGSLLWTLLNKDETGDPMMRALPSNFAKVGGVFTPFVYVLMHKKFRQTFRGFFSCTNSNSVIPMERSRNQSIFSTAVL